MLIWTIRIKLQIITLNKIEMTEKMTGFFKNNLDNSIEEDLDKGIENQITNTKILIIQLMSFKHNRKEEPWSIS
jgi:hypothetical protein